MKTYYCLKIPPLTKLKTWEFTYAKTTSCPATLPNESEKKLDINRTHISKLKDKLKILCDNRRWRNIDIIQNISDIALTPVELEALQFGLKFTTGINKLNIINTIKKNYKHNDSDFHKGFIQGIIAATTTNQKNASTLPRIYNSSKEMIIKQHTHHPL